MKLTRILRILGAILFGFACIFLITWINYQIIGNWFGKNGPANLGSIEVSYVTMAKFIKEGRTWVPYWYLGFPFHLFYTPLLPYLEFITNNLSHVSLWESYRLVTGLAYILGPISVFLFGWQLSKRFIGGLIAGVLYSVGPTIFYFLDEGVRGDRISVDLPNHPGFLDPRRFTILIRWGEGPHTLSLVFVPLVGVFFAKYLDNHNFRNLVLTCIFLGLAGLTNALGLFSGILLIFSMGFVKWARDHKKGIKSFLSSFVVLFITLGLISFWYNLSFVSNFFGEGGGTVNSLLALFPWGWVAGILTLGVVYLLVRKIIKDFGIAFSLVWFLIFLSVVYTYYFHKVELLPQALRYNVEVDLSLSLLIGVFFGWIVRRLGKRHFTLEIFTTFLGFLAVAGLYFYVQAFVPTASKASAGIVNLSNTRELEIANWLNNNVNKAYGERVFIPGNYGFYLNYFNNVWQVRGGLYQASTHPWPDHAYYQISTGTDPEISTAWLKILNTKFTVVNSTGSAELYHDVKNFYRFDNFNKVYESAGDIIYQIPLDRESVSKPVSILAMPNLTPPRKADDKKPITTYANWIGKSSLNETSFQVIDNDNYQINGEIDPGEGILVQMTYDDGWIAKDKYTNKKIKIDKDPMGFLVLYPEPGNVSIQLKHKRSWDVWVGYGTTLVTVIIIVIYGLFSKKSKKL